MQAYPLVQRPPPIGRSRPCRKITVSPMDIHPVIRIAHRRSGALNIPDRILLDHELVLIVKGTGQFRIGQNVYEYQPRDLFFIRPFQLNRITASQAVGEHIAVHFDFAPDLPPSGRGLAHRQPYEIEFVQGHRLRDHYHLTGGDPIEPLLTQLLRDRSAKGLISQAEAAAQLLRILLLLFKRETSIATLGSSGARIEIMMQRAAVFAENHLSQKLSADDLANAAGLSASHFNRRFRQWSGHSPVEYLRRLRVDKARKLLADVDLSIKEIARLTGFDDAYHFSKVFRRVDGLPPTRYRESLLAGRL
jgi:AraC-like DNA-binding protein